MTTLEAFVWSWSFVCLVLSLGLHCTSSDDTDDEPEVHCTKNNDDIRGICLRLIVWLLCSVIGSHCTSSDDTDDEPEVHCTKKNDDIRGICLRSTFCLPCSFMLGPRCRSSDDTDDEPEVHCTKQSMMRFEAFVWGSCLFELAAPVPLFFVLRWHTHSRFNFWSALHCKPCWFHGRPLSEAGMHCQKIAYREDNTAIQRRYTRRAWSALR